MPNRIEDLLVEARVEVEGDVSVLAEEIDVEALGLLLDGAEDEQRLAHGQTRSDAALVRHRLKSCIRALRFHISSMLRDIRPGNHSSFTNFDVSQKGNITSFARSEK